jgi:hypothetical protein
MADIEEIRRIATEVRTAMDTLIAENKIPQWCIPFPRFPAGCCGDISIILATHFKNAGFGLGDYICGRYVEDGRSHAWLRLDGICIDITADQFNFASFPKVIVEYEQDYPLNKLFETDTPPSTYEIDRPHLSSVYTQIKEKISS